MTFLDGWSEFDVQLRREIINYARCLLHPKYKMSCPLFHIPIIQWEFPNILVKIIKMWAFNLEHLCIKKINVLCVY